MPAFLEVRDGGPEPEIRARDLEMGGAKAARERHGLGELERFRYKERRMND